MDFKVASAIYSKPWLIDSQRALEYLNTLEEIKAGKTSFIKTPSAELKQYSGNATIVAAPDNRYSAKEHPGYEGKTIAILSVSGPLMKDDYCGRYGTNSIREEFNRISNTESIQTIILLCDSPGGQVDGTEPFADAIKACKKNTVAVITGVCASACYWLASSCKKIIATAHTDMIGSIGTMISFYDRSLYMEQNGMILREYVADASQDKNKDYREALEGRGRLLVEQLLNPTNDILLANVKTNRGAKLNEKETLTGKVFLSDKALEYGLIDQISSFDNTINNILKSQKSVTTISMKWKSLMALLGLSAATEKVELKDEHLDKVEASIEEGNKTKENLSTANARIQELETSAQTDKEKITGLEAKVTGLQNENKNLKAENEKLGAKDGEAFSNPKGEKDKFNDDKETDAMSMAFQKELMDKV